MAAITDKLDRVTDNTTGRPIVATLASPGKAIAAASINISAATNWTTTTAIHFTIYNTVTVAGIAVKDGTTQTDWKGTLSGTTISNLTLTGGTDRAYSAGAIVELTPTAAYAKELFDNISTQHNQDGTHSNITAAGTLAVTGASTFTGAVTLPANTVVATKESNPYKFSVYRTAAWTLGPSVNYKIPFDTKEYDTSTNFDATTNFRFVAPVAGFYKFDARASWAQTSADYCFIMLYKNGAQVKRGNFLVAPGSNTVGVLVCPPPLQLAVSDYIEIYVSQTNATITMNGLAGVNETYFGGYLVSAT